MNMKFFALKNLPQTKGILNVFVIRPQNCIVGKLHVKLSCELVLDKYIIDN